MDAHERKCNPNSFYEKLKESYESRLTELTRVNDKLEMKLRILNKEHDRELEIQRDNYDFKLKSKDERIEELLLDRNDLSNKLYKIASKDTTIINNSGGNKITQYLNQHPMLNLDPEFINEQLTQNFTKTHFLKGTRGVVDFTIEHIITDENGDKLYVASDPSRNIFRFRTDDGIVKDMNGTTLIKELHPRLMSFIHENIFSLNRYKNGDFDHLDETTIEKFFKKLHEIQSINNKPDSFIKVLTPQIV